MTVKTRFAQIESTRVSNWRRTGHSAAQYFTSIDRSSFSKGNIATQSVNAVSNFGSVAGGVGGGIAIHMSAAAAGGLAGAGFLAAVAGPQVAVTAAVVGLALLIKGSYSNRDSAHEELRKYAWSLMHDEMPTPLTLQNCVAAADAASTLLDDGKNQIKLMGKKMEKAQAGFAIVNTRMKELQDQLIGLRQTKTRLKNSNVLGARAQFPVIDQDIQATRAKAAALWEKEARSGGAIFEYVRRCSHTANYLQAPHILSVAMRCKFENALPAHAGQDFFQGSALVDSFRKTFTDLDAMYSTLSDPEPAI